MERLTESQQTAVEHQFGPLLVLAGPGSGKTRVITHRIARLVDRGVDPRRILAITFTNKAAREMSDRVRRLVPGRQMWISTFHKFCAYLLRRNARMIGLKSNFTIFSTSDQKSVLKQVLNDLDIDPVHYPPGNILNQISKAKNDLVSANQFARNFNESTGDHYQAVVARAFPEYQKLLLRSNAVDFDDLLMHVVQLLAENNELRAQIDEHYQYTLVDEYQDTNLAQYQLIRMLSHDQQNICATGDPDQSIYGWRGARIDNILRFERDYPESQLVRLQDNFRSTKSILKAADELIAHNVQRKPKELFTNNDVGKPVELHTYTDGREEADMVAASIKQLAESEGVNWSDVAIFYRVNALSRELELALTRWQIPYQVAAGVAFYERAEIKDMLSYLRLICNPDDYAAFARIVNRPTRGIGKQTQNKLRRWAAQNRWTMTEAIHHVEEHPTLNKRAKFALKKFGELMDHFSLADSGSMEQLLRSVIDRIGYLKGMKFTEADYEQTSNIEELLTVARQYDKENPDDPTLEGFLESTSLASDLDAIDSEAGQVTLMTMHAAKGLEFPHVFIIGVEQNLIPHERALKTNDASEYEEERRLLFVGITRAERGLVLTQTRQRAFRGKTLHTIPSDFVREMSLEQLNMASGFGTSTSSQYDRDWSRPKEPAHDWNELSQEITVDNLHLLGDKLDALKANQPSDLNSSSAEEPPLDPGSFHFDVGMQVRHPRYGRGKIVHVSGPTSKATVTVDFVSGEVGKTFRADRCPLQPIGMR
ncbi:ATP-dependent DNA helicase PcrA [Polystyrenella longa]|uniref:DNA 3'-5' helicase n=1 Tax=Polystyrenella longa TaxID=2528007 RepID=A0A518CH23_9PLAN|nr:UvrD-helicase domain-containing protein [Polystyrenella longa]QDU78523.1 ATP-dependent DNA helicase PcrA [Polystyrenella longa]